MKNETNHEYTGDSILLLEGLETVRVRFMKGQVCKYDWNGKEIALHKIRAKKRGQGGTVIGG